MSVNVASDQQIIGEATRLLLEHMSPSDVARLWAAWHLGEGDYLAMRARLFEGESVDSLAPKVREYQSQQ